MKYAIKQVFREPGTRQLKYRYVDAETGEILTDLTGYEILSDSNTDWTGTPPSNSGDNQEPAEKVGQFTPNKKRTQPQNYWRPENTQGNPNYEPAEAIIAKQQVPSGSLDLGASLGGWAAGTFLDPIGNLIVGERTPDNGYGYIGDTFGEKIMKGLATVGVTAVGGPLAGLGVAAVIGKNNSTAVQTALTEKYGITDLTTKEKIQLGMGPEAVDQALKSIGSRHNANIDLPSVLGPAAPTPTTVNPQTQAVSPQTNLPTPIAPGVPSNPQVNPDLPKWDLGAYPPEEAKPTPNPHPDIYTPPVNPGNTLGVTPKEVQTISIKPGPGQEPYVDLPAPSVNGDFGRSWGENAPTPNPHPDVYNAPQTQLPNAQLPSQTFMPQEFEAASPQDFQNAQVNQGSVANTPGFMSNPNQTGGQGFNYSPTTDLPDIPKDTQAYAPSSGNTYTRAQLDSVNPSVARMVAAETATAEDMKNVASVILNRSDVMGVSPAEVLHPKEFQGVVPTASLDAAKAAVLDVTDPTRRTTSALVYATQDTVQNLGIKGLVEDMVGPKQPNGKAHVYYDIDPAKNPDFSFRTVSGGYKPADMGVYNELQNQIKGASSSSTGAGISKQEQAYGYVNSDGFIDAPYSDPANYGPRVDVPQLAVQTEMSEKKGNLNQGGSLASSLALGQDPFAAIGGPLGFDTAGTQISIGKDGTISISPEGSPNFGSSSSVGNLDSNYGYANSTIGDGGSYTGSGFSSGQTGDNNSGSSWSGDSNYGGYSTNTSDYGSGYAGVGSSGYSSGQTGDNNSGSSWSGNSDYGGYSTNTSDYGSGYSGVGSSSYSSSSGSNNNNSSWSGNSDYGNYSTNTSDYGSGYSGVGSSGYSSNTSSGYDSSVGSNTGSNYSDYGDYSWL